MPSPCEVVEAPAPLPEQIEVVVPMPGSRGFPHRVIPALVGGVFAGLLLVGLGCTPFFQKQPMKAAPEQPIVVQASKAGMDASIVSTGSSPAPASTGRAMAEKPSPAGAASTMIAAAPASSTVVSGTATIAASSSRRGGIASSDSMGHGFMISCVPAHQGEDANAPRPETAALQGIMAGRNNKAALLDGVLYREGDRFGSAVCPWTIAMIDAASVRIEKAFGDRTCGVTIRYQTDKPSASSPVASKAKAPTTTAMKSR